MIASTKYHHEYILKASMQRTILNAWDMIKLNLVLSNNIESKTKAEREQREHSAEPKHIVHDLANHIDEWCYFFDQIQKVHQFCPNYDYPDHYCNCGHFMTLLSNIAHAFNTYNHIVSLE